jgi:hypothetical protein
MRNYFALYLFFLLCTGCLLLTSCSKSDDQRDFENHALSEPEGITETNSNGDVINTDPDDWRISPMYQGLISIGTPDNQPPYPNPFSFNQELIINIYIRSIETLSRIEVYSFEFPSEANSSAITIREDISSPHLETITLSGQLISGYSGGSQAAGLYRILIYDGQQNLITYGDVQIGSS